jgi:AcrR family transcriptional regulator
MNSYHHGNLRESLIDAARTVLAERGVGSLSLRDLARRIGVSATAPYHHFASKAELVDALALDALSELDRTSGAVLNGLSDPGDRLQALGVAYVLFAVDHPERFRLAFRPEMGGPFARLDSEELPQSVPGFRLLLQVVAEARAQGLVWGESDALVALRAWSLVHGLAALLVDGPLQALASDRARVEALARALTGGWDKGH